MAILIKMPKLGLEMEQGTVLEWFFESGDDVSEGDTIAEVESEKSIGEVEAREDGVLRRIYVEEGESVPPGTPIGILAAADADISDLEAEAEAELEGETDEDTDESGATGDDSDVAADEQQVAAASAGGTTEVKASPRARKAAEEQGIDLTTVEGTGPMDSITVDDVKAAANGSQDSTESVKASPRAKKRAEELGVDLTTVEGTGPMDSITVDDVEAADAAASTDETDDSLGQTVPQRYQQVTAVADPAAGSALLETTEAVRGAFEERVTVTDVVLLVTSAALADQSVVNGTYSESTHQVQERQDIALVSNLDDDLEETVVEQADDSSLTEIVEARETGGDGDVTATFTLAAVGDDPFEGILANPPGVAALEVDPSGQRAVPDGDGVDLQPLVTARLTYDTRAIGSTEAEAFLEQFFERAEQSSELVLDSYRGKL